jgi:hypothetical protein
MRDRLTAVARRINEIAGRVRRTSGACKCSGTGRVTRIFHVTGDHDFSPPALPSDVCECGLALSVVNVINRYANVR